MASKRMVGRKKRKPAQQRYVMSGRSETNKEKRIARAKKRIKRLAERRDQ